MWVFYTALSHYPEWLEIGIEHDLFYSPPSLPFFLSSLFSFCFLKSSLAIENRALRLPPLYVLWVLITQFAWGFSIQLWGLCWALTSVGLNLTRAPKASWVAEIFVSPCVCLFDQEYLQVACSLQVMAILPTSFTNVPCLAPEGIWLETSDSGLPMGGRDCQVRQWDPCYWITICPDLMEALPNWPTGWMERPLNDPVS